MRSPLLFSVSFYKFFLINFLFLTSLFYANVYALELQLITPAAAAKIVYGKKSPETKNLQKSLNSLGYTVAETGPGSDGQETELYDQNLKKAIKEFQIENELKVTEKLDAPTIKVLNELITFLNENSQEEDVISSTYTTDIDDTYGNDPDLNKDFFADGEGLNYFGDGERDVLSYVGNALKNYADINITGMKGITSGTILDSKKDPSQRNDGAVRPETPATILQARSDAVDTGNIFQDSMLKTILGNASVLFYKTFILGSTGALTQIGGDGDVNENTDTQRIPKIEDYYTDGKFDPVKCFSDPICANL